MEGIGVRSPITNLIGNYRWTVTEGDIVQAKDITHHLERLGAFENRLGVTVEGFVCQY